MVAGRLRWRGGVVCFGGLEEPLGEGGVRGLAPEGERRRSPAVAEDSDCTRSEPSILPVNGPDLSLQ